MQPTTSPLATDSADAFARECHRHRADALALARQLAPNSAAAEDLVQEAMIRAVRYRASFAERGDRDRDLRAWLRRIVRSRAAEAWETERSRKDLEATFCDDMRTPSYDSDAAETQSPEEERARALWRAIAGLAPEFRDALVRAYVLGQSRKQIAEDLGIPFGTVLSRTHRARRDIRIALGLERRTA